MRSGDALDGTRAFFDTLSADCRAAWRSLMMTRGFTAVAVVTLAVGIGANTAVLSMADPVLLRPLPYAASESLVALRSSNPAAGFPSDRTSLADLLDWQLHTRAFEALAGYRWRSADLLGGDHSERLRGLFVTPEFFQVFGVRDVLGRVFTRDDCRPGNHIKIILGSHLWRRRFASDPGVVGRMLDVNTLNLSRVGPTSRLVVGVVTRDVHFPPFSADFQLDVAGIDESVDFWTPELILPNANRSARELEVVGRLKPGVTIAQAQTEMDGIAARLAREYPQSNRGWGVRVVPLRHEILGHTRSIVLLLSLCSIVVLLVACVNVTSLQIARGLARQRDVAIQVALGAGRRRIVTQVFVEAALLATMAAIVGALIAAWGVLLLRPLLPPSAPLLRQAAVDARVIGLTFGVTLVATLCISVVPWVRNWTRSAADITRTDGRGLSPDRRRRYALATLVALEVAVTLVLLVGAGLLLRSAVNLLRIQPGFNADNLLTMTISLPSNKFEWKHNVVFSRQVIESVRSLGHVDSAAVVQGVPMRGGSFWSTFVPDNGQAVNPADPPVARLRVVSPGYFRAMQIPILSGRDFDARDEVGEIGFAPQVIVSRALAARFWPGEDAVGKRIGGTGPQQRWSTIVGVAGDVRYGGMDTDPGFEMYLPEGLFPQAAITLLVRTRGEPMSSATDIQKRIAEVDRDAFVTDVQPMTELISDSLAARRLSLVLLTIFAGTALALALAGIYSVTSQSVAQRRVEIAIRITLGAAPDTVSRLIFLHHGFLPGLAGIVAGVLASFAAARLLSTMLFQVRPYDPTTWAAMTAIVIATCLIASYVPARRAALVDPNLALRSV